MPFLAGVILIGSGTLLGAEALYRARIRALSNSAARVHMNRFGFRGPEIDSLKHDGITRIIAVGASTTFDPCVAADSEAWTARLEHYLEQKYRGRDFQVLNAGVPGAPMADQLIRLKTRLLAFSPDVVLVYANHGIVTSRDAHLPTAIDTSARAQNESAVGRWLRHRSRLYDRVRPATSPGNEQPTNLTTAQWTIAVDNAASDFHSALTAFLASARGYGARVVFVEINRVSGSKKPVEYSETERDAWLEYLGDTPPEVVHNGYARFHDIWRNVAEAGGATFLSADSVGITGAKNYCARDPIHFSPAGSDLMGRRLAEAIHARRILETD